MGIPVARQDTIMAAELLPDWDEEWLAADWERHRLLRLKALERAALARWSDVSPAMLSSLRCRRCRPSRSAKARAAWSCMCSWPREIRPKLSIPTASTGSLLRQELGLAIAARGPADPAFFVAGEMSERWRSAGRRASRPSAGCGAEIEREEHFMTP